MAWIRQGFIINFTEVQGNRNNSKVGGPIKFMNLDMTGSINFKANIFFSMC